MVPPPLWALLSFFSYLFFFSRFLSFFLLFIFSIFSFFFHLGTSITCSGTGRRKSKKRMDVRQLFHHLWHRSIESLHQGRTADVSQRCAPWCAAELVPAARALREPRAATPRCLRQTTRRSPLPRLLWSSVSVELGTQPPRPCPSSVPVGRRTLHQPPPCPSCGGRLRTGPLRRSAAHFATMSASVAAFAARRRRVRHAATCRPLGLSRTVTQKKRAHLLSLVVVVVVNEGWQQ